MEIKENEKEYQGEERRTAVKCEVCDGRGWYLARLTHDFRTTCANCGGYGTLPENKLDNSISQSV